MSNKGKVQSADDEKTEVGVVEYTRGPVKLMERARAKAQNDYASEPYPVSACVIDFNRCALIFDDISSLLRGLQLFVNKVKYYQSGNIIAIARDKNGFIEYMKEAQYADIKLNVVIKGKCNSIIGEVQFLLRAMKEYKDKAHNLYAIQRKEETIRSSVSATLPILLDQQKEIVGVACDGIVKKMCSLMILQNKSIKDVMFVGPTEATVFVPICCVGHLNCLKFLESMMSRNEFIDFMFLSNMYDSKPIECAVKYSNSSLVKYLFDMKEIQDRYKNSDPLVFRLLLHLFGNNTDENLTESVLSALNFTKKKVISMLNYKCPKQPKADNKGASQYHNDAIIGHVIFSGTLDHLKRLTSQIGQQALVENVFTLDGLGWDAMGYALMKKNNGVIEYLLSIKEIKNKYLSDNNLLRRLIRYMNQFIEYEESVQCTVDHLGLTTSELQEVQSFRYVNISSIIPFTKW